MKRTVRKDSPDLSGKRNISHGHYSTINFANGGSDAQDFVDITLHVREVVRVLAVREAVVDTTEITQEY